MHKMESTIRHKAYEIWQAEGQPAGRDIAHWLRAEEEVARPRPRAVKQRRATGISSRRKATV